ncbi:MAG: hypothetical protein IPM16_20655 [Chloroflexi bacterium]|nr:hypothetical protein [Chloroflexota bacterium]
MTVRRVSFPLMGSYHIAEKALAEGIGAEVVLPPPLTKRTLELGTKYSPEAICVPFKYVLGNFIEAIERGANAVIQVGGGCRLGCYAELQRAILTSLGYEVDYLTIGGRNTIPEIFGFIRRYYPNLSLFAIVQALYRAFEKARAIDDFEDVMRKNIGFEVKAGSFERLQKRFLAELDQASALRDIWRVRREYLEDVRQIEVD